MSDTSVPTGATQANVEIVRAHAGLVAVIAGDVVIAVAAILGVLEIHGSKNADAMVSVLSSAFTAIGTLTSAYFGIKAVANTAKNAVANAGGAGQGPGGGGPGGGGDPGADGGQGAGGAAGVPDPTVAQPQTPGAG